MDILLMKNWEKHSYIAGIGWMKIRGLFEYYYSYQDLIITPYDDGALPCF